MKGRGEPLAAIVHASLLDEPRLVEAVRATARFAVDNERLGVELLAGLEEVVASRARIVEAGDAERKRIERNLHDGAQQRAFGSRPEAANPAGGRCRQRSAQLGFGGRRSATAR